MMSLDYLVSIGIDCWVSWQSLPGAAPSLFELVETDQQKEGLPGKISENPISSLKENRKKVSPVDPAKNAVDKVAEVIKDKSVSKSTQQNSIPDSLEAYQPCFYEFSYVWLGDILIVTDQAETHRIDLYKSLLSAIIKFLGAEPSCEWSLSHFVWPPFYHKELPGQSQTVAVRSFRRLLLDGVKPKKVLNFCGGSEVLSLISLSLNFNDDTRVKSLQVISFPSIGAMLDDSSLKILAWQAIKKIVA